MKIFFQVFVALIFTIPNQLFSQFSVEKYKQFLEENKSLTSLGILAQYPAGLFIDNVNADVHASEYFTRADSAYGFSSDEQRLLAKNGFVVLGDTSFPSFSNSFLDVYHRDLPVYISADAILHALHRSYDNMLRDIELYALKDQLAHAVTKLRDELAKISAVEPSGDLERIARQDADVYITVLNNIGGTNNALNPFYSENAEQVRALETAVADEKFTTFPLFAVTPRKLDFSQFKPRGHYADIPELREYFRAMMWLGRTEIYITKPISDPQPTDEDIRRQCALALLLGQLAQTSGALAHLDSMDALISAFVGAQDNLTTTDLLAITSKSRLTIEELNDKSKLKQFQDDCIANGAGQKILSQVLIANGDTKIVPAAAYMLMGQRFIIDSYIFGSVVHDKVKWRLMPSTLDAMFALGNNSALQLLTQEIDRYKYAPNLAGLRYLVDSYGETDWNSSIYSGWLHAIGMLNPPSQEKRSELPSFMQTAAWGQKTLNTQLASWAELRHDNLLYAKQSYTGGIGCFYPKGFVEPNPELFSAIAEVADSLGAVITRFSGSNSRLNSMTSFTTNIGSVCKSLASIAEKELIGEPLNQTDKSLISNWIMSAPAGGCDPSAFFTGIYQSLLYDVSSHMEDDAKKPTFTIADVHTQPTDLEGTMVGRVLHVATGAPNLAVILAKDKDGCTTTYCGPVSSYFEYISENFERLTDEEWTKMYHSQSLRPALTNLYMSDSIGSKYQDAPSLFLGIKGDPSTTLASPRIRSYPNPTTSSTLIAFTTDMSQSNKTTTVEIFTTTGERVTTLLSRKLGEGNHLVRWDGTNSLGERVADGVFLVAVEIGGESAIAKIVVARE